MTNVVIAGGSEETRLLLRGLLRLYRHRVLADGAGFDVFEQVDVQDSSASAVVDIDLDDGASVNALKAAMAARPQVRVLLLTPHTDGVTKQRAKELGIAGLIPRPFAVRELIEAIEGSPTRSVASAASPRQR